MVQHEKSHEKHQQQPPGQAGSSPTPPQHQGPVAAPSESEVLGGTGSPTSGPTGEPMVKPPENPPGQPEEGSESAAGKVGETDPPFNPITMDTQEAAKKKS